VSASKALLVRGKQWSAEIGKHDLNVPAPLLQKTRYPPSARGSIDSKFSSHLHIDQVHFGGMRRKMYLRVIHKQIVHHLNHKEHSFDYKQMTSNFHISVEEIIHTSISVIHIAEPSSITISAADVLHIRTCFRTCAPAPQSISQCSKKEHNRKECRSNNLIASRNHTDHVLPWLVMQHLEHPEEVDLRNHTSPCISGTQE
jgi:hypothetical protein